MAELTAVEFLKAMIYERATIVLVGKFVYEVLEEFYAVPLHRRLKFLPLSVVWGLPWGMGKLMGSASEVWMALRGPGAIVYFLLALYTGITPGNRHEKCTCDHPEGYHPMAIPLAASVIPSTAASIIASYQQPDHIASMPIAPPFAKPMSKPITSSSGSKPKASASGDKPSQAAAMEDINAGLKRKAVGTGGEPSTPFSSCTFSCRLTLDQKKHSSTKVDRDEKLAVRMGQIVVIVSKPTGTNTWANPRAAAIAVMETQKLAVNGLRRVMAFNREWDAAEMEDCDATEVNRYLGSQTGRRDSRRIYLLSAHRIPRSIYENNGIAPVHLAGVVTKPESDTYSTEEDESDAESWLGSERCKVLAIGELGGGERGPVPAITPSARVSTATFIIYIVRREKYMQQQRQGVRKKKVQKYILPGHENVYSAATF
ncbi:hypothetical protein B0H17DRAFT_1155328 [Mycena rosella]|uniref:Uncharacterized protein n=1 Tax=Mycena rosella TaxID=1033263 RepID=A0AAD7AWG6_MYCRO|nr:hypothetical protein B0H17DRAFT_1155328 [Mycena rosella]